MRAASLTYKSRENGIGKVDRNHCRVNFYGSSFIYLDTWKCFFSLFLSFLCHSLIFSRMETADRKCVSEGRRRWMQPKLLQRKCVVKGEKWNLVDSYNQRVVYRVFVLFFPFYPSFSPHLQARKLLNHLQLRNELARKKKGCKSVVPLQDPICCTRIISESTYLSIWSEKE